jgi:heparinase II/III-like protein
MKRGVVILPDPRVPRRTVTTLPHELRVRGVQVLRSFHERVGLALSGGSGDVHRAPRDVVRPLRDDPTRTVEAARRRLAEGITPGLRRISATVGVLRRAVPDAESTTRCRADRAVDGVFDLLGHRAVSFGNPIDWHLDPTSGIRAPMRHWSRIQYLDPATVGDYKLVWEVNRHQHFVTLGQAYAYSRDSRYADAFVAQLTGWIQANPPRLGMNWASSLEVSYRAISWLWALQLFAEAPQLTDAVLATALESLRRHAEHIERYLSTYHSPNTHLTGEALGLLYLGTALPIFEAAEWWRRLGWSILREQLFRQTRADGTYYEQALYYHRYTSDIYHHALVLAAVNGWERDDAVCARVERLDEFLVHAVHPDGTVPLVGDDDGGRLMRLDGLPTRDARPTLATGAALFNRSDMRCVGANAIEECVWLLGEEGARTLSSVRSQSPSGGSRGFPDGGFYVLRDGWTASSMWALVDGGPHGALNCGHAHADALSLELSTGGRPVLADSGTFAYTGIERERFRATALHNTATVDGESSSLTGGLFHWRHIAKTTVHAWLSTTGADYWRGSHDGYARLTDPAVHERTVLFVHGRYVVVLDALEAKDAHDLVVHWHCAPDLEFANDGGHAVEIVDPSRSDGSLLQVFSLGDGRIESGRSWRSETYGEKREAGHIAITLSGRGRQRVGSLLVPSAAHARPIQGASGEQVAEVVGARFSDRVAWRGSAATIESAGMRSDAECIVETRDAAGTPERLYLLGATYAEGAGLDRQDITGGAPFAARYELGRWWVEPFRTGSTGQV